MYYKADHKGPPTETVMCRKWFIVSYDSVNKVFCFQKNGPLQFEGKLLSKGPQQPLKCLSTLLSNVI